MTSKMVVHGIPGSPYVRAALLTLEEKGADYEFAAMAPGALKQHPHLSRHPFGRIPTFEQDGWMLYETKAIMRYVDAVVPGPRLQPGEPRAAARLVRRVDQLDQHFGFAERSEHLAVQHGCNCLARCMAPVSHRRGSSKGRR
jgi:glutathione S-transferase